MTISLRQLVCILVCVGFANSASASPAPLQDQKTESKKQDDKNSDAKATDEKKKDKPAPMVFKVAKGKIEFTCSGTWKKVEKKSSMLDAEFKIPRKGTDKADGRLTFMGAGGGADANIERWLDQFNGPVVSKITEITVNGLKVHMVDIKGTYMESAGGPFGPKTDRDDYRMLAAIIETKTYGDHFLKLTGPNATLESNKKKFESLVKSVKLEK